jgi:hypothetical protein
MSEKYYDKAAIDAMFPGKPIATPGLAVRVTGLGKADGTYLVVRATQTELVLTPKTGFEPEGGDHE